jgi:hypothetical protein
VNINYFWMLLIKDQFHYFDFIEVQPCPKKNMNVCMKLVCIRC